MTRHILYLSAATFIVTILGCGAQPQDVEATHVTATSELINWIDQLDSDLEREFKSYELNDAGAIIYVDLQDAQLTDNDIARFESMTQLEHLNISGNEITDEGLAHLAGLTNLQYLDVGFSLITDDGLQHLERLAQLQSLLLNGLDDENQLTDKGVLHLLSLGQLQELHLNSAHISDDSVDTLLKLQKLRTLDISWTQITEEGYQRLRKGLPDCNIERNSGA